MQTPIEQLLNLPDIQVLNVEITETNIKCDIESKRGYIDGVHLQPPLSRILMSCGLIFFLARG